MRRALSLYVVTLFLISMGSHADTCVPLPGQAGGPYSTLASFSKRELDFLLSEYMFAHRWTRHPEAVSAGFRYGDRVYGEVLKQGGRFNPERTAAWRAAYAKSERPRFLARIEPKLNVATVDRHVVSWILGTCLEGGVWSEVRMLSQCRFVFSAGLLAVSAAGPAVRPVQFEVRGGRCARWPERPLSVKGDGVQCVRSREAVSVVLQTDRAGAASEALTEQVSDLLPREPLQETKLSEPVSEAIRLTRSRDFRLRQLGRGCPSCTLYSADVRPSASDATILSAATVSSAGSGWLPCPAGLRCGVYEFTPPDDPRTIGCSNQRLCRVWRLAEGEGEAYDVIQVTYQKPEVVCANCPAGTDFETARQQWLALKERSPGRCETFADSPAQTFNWGRSP